MTTSTDYNTGIDFEALYIRLRQHEGRVYSDFELMQLPHISPAHPLHHEWRIRSRSAEKLVAYLARKKQPMQMLEIGCGNGWLCHMLSSVTGSQVIGIDVNFTELQQAARVFQDFNNLHFIYTDISNEPFREKKFDIIVFAASIQYFESLTAILAIALKLLKPGGEIHILDSPFYSTTEINAAKHRSQVYYEEAGFPAMADCYFHHGLQELRQFRPSVLYNPKNPFNRLAKVKRPFYWLTVCNK